MDIFIGELEKARGLIGEHAEAIDRELRAAHAATGGLAPVREVGRWIDEQVPRLRQRRETITSVKDLPWFPARGAVPYPENGLLSPAEARRQGRELADRLRKVYDDGLLPPLQDPPPATAREKIIDELRKHAQDADFTAAFFGRLGAERTLNLPEALRWTDEQQVAVSMALGTAVSGGGKVPGFAAVLRALRKPGAPNVGRLVSHGRFPAEWLAALAIDRLFIDKRTGAEEKNGLLTALGNNPAAARLAITAMTKDSPRVLPRLEGVLPAGLLSQLKGDGRPDLAAFLTTLSKEHGGSPAFARMLAAASGAYDERDGAHSREAARFAFTVMTTRGLQITGPGRIHLSELAGSYATEITQGAFLGDAEQLEPSQFVPASSRVPGLKPTFRLSPIDTAHFLQRFSTELGPFQQGMGLLSKRLIDEATRTALTSKKTTALDQTFRALGKVRGFELAAVKNTGKALKEEADSRAKSNSVILGAGLGVAGLAVPGGLGAQLFWLALSTTVSTADTYKPDPEDPAAKIDGEEDPRVVVRPAAIAQALMDVGYPPVISPKDYQALCPPGVAIAAPDGRLRSLEEIATHGEPGLQALDTWLIENGMGSDDALKIGKVAYDAAERFEGAKLTAEKRAIQFGRQSD